MSDEAWRNGAAAERFVVQLASAPPEVLWPAVPPVLDREPYLSAWLNVETALGNAPEADRRRLEPVIREFDRVIAAIRMDPALAEAARRAMRALLVRPWLHPPESFEFVYEPFESTVPPATLER